MVCVMWGCSAPSLLFCCYILIAFCDVEAWPASPPACSVLIYCAWSSCPRPCFPLILQQNREALVESLPCLQSPPSLYFFLRSCKVALKNTWNEESFFFYFHHFHLTPSSGVEVSLLWAHWMLCCWTGGGWGEEEEEEEEEGGGHIRGQTSAVM